MRTLVLSISLISMLATCAAADTIDPAISLFTPRPGHDAWSITWPSCRDEVAGVPPVRLPAFSSIRFEQNDVQPLHHAAIEHSDGYRTRARIHKYASLATLPLFATEAVLGQSLYTPSTASDGRRAAHAIVGSAIVGLFGVNTVTGAWNLFGEGWSDKEGRTRRMVHGVLMMAADVGFLATAASGPNSGGRRGALAFETDKVTHRNIAVASISVGTAGYLLMLFGNH